MKLIARQIVIDILCIVAILLAAPTCYGLSSFAENDVVNGKCIRDYTGDDLDSVLPSPSSVLSTRRVYRTYSPTVTLTYGS